MSNEYPLIDCQDCIHNQVCKWIDQFNKVKKMGLPLAFPGVECTQYAVVEPMDEPEAPTPVLEHTNPANVEEYINQKLLINRSNGITNETLVMSEETLEILKDFIDVRGSDPYFVHTIIGLVSIYFVNQLPLGMFYLTDKL